MSRTVKKIVINSLAGLSIVGGVIGTSIVLTNLVAKNIKNYTVTYSNLNVIRNSLLNEFSKTSSSNPLTIDEFINKVNDGNLKLWINDNFKDYFKTFDLEEPFDFNLSLTENENEISLVLSPLENMTLKMLALPDEYNPSIIEFVKNQVIFKFNKSDFFNEQLFNYSQLNLFKQRIINALQANKITFEDLINVSDKQEKNLINDWVCNSLQVNNIFESIKFIKLPANNAYSIKFIPNRDYVLGLVNNQTSTTEFVVNRREMSINFNNVIVLSNSALVQLKQKVGEYIQQQRMDYYLWLEHIQNKDVTYQSLIDYIYSQLNVILGNTLPTSNFIGDLELINENDKIFSLKIIPESGYSLLSDSIFYDNGNVILPDIDFYSYIQFTSDNLFIFKNKLQQTIDEKKYSVDNFEDWITSDQFINYLEINLRTSNNSNVDITKIETAIYDVDSNIITIIPKSMYKFEILGTTNGAIVNDKGQLLISSLNLYEYINFTKLSDFFDTIQDFIKDNKFTNQEFLDYVIDSNNLYELKKLVSNNLYISENKTININKISNISIINNNLTITFNTSYTEYSSETYSNISLNNNLLTIKNLNFFTVTNIMKLSELFDYIQTQISTNKYTEDELSQYITNNLDAFKNLIANKLYISEYTTISSNQITNISVDENKQLRISLNNNYIKYDVETYANIVLENNDLVVKNLVYYTSIQFRNLNTLYDSIQNKIQTSKYTKSEFDSYVSNSNNDLKTLIANNLYISDNEKLSVDKIISVSFNSSSNQLSVVLSSNYLKYSITSNNNVSITGTTLTISNLEYFTLYTFTSINNLYSAIQNIINSTSNKYTASEFKTYVTNNQDSLKTLISQNLYISSSTTLDKSNISSVSLNSSNNLEITLNSNYIKYSLSSNTNVTLSNNVLTVKNLVYYAAINLTKLSELYTYLEDFITTNTYTPDELRTYINNNPSTFKTNIANKLYISNSSTISSSLISSVSLNSSNNLEITLSSTNRKYTMDSYNNASLSGTRITIKNLTSFYTKITFSNLNNVKSKYQEIINDNSYTADDFTLYAQKNNSSLRNIFIDNVSVDVSGPGSWSTSQVNSSVSFNGSSLKISLTPPSKYKYSWSSATNVSFSNNTFTFSAFSWYDQSPSNYFTWTGTTITGLASGYNPSSIIIPNNCTAIGFGAFFRNSKITSVTIPGTVKTIDQEAFRECTNLSDVTLKNGITSINKWAFSRCYKLTSITVPGSVGTIGYGAFYASNKLSSVTLENGIRVIDEWAFQSCEALSSIDIPESVTTINYSAFADINNLTRVWIRSNSSLTLGSNCFGGLPVLSSVYIYLENSSNFTVHSGAFSNSRSGYLYVRTQSMYNKLINAKLSNFLGTASDGHIILTSF